MRVKTDDTVFDVVHYVHLRHFFLCNFLN